MDNSHRSVKIKENLNLFKSFGNFTKQKNLSIQLNLLSWSNQWSIQMDMHTHGQTIECGERQENQMKILRALELIWIEIMIQIGVVKEHLHYHVLKLIVVQPSFLARNLLLNEII